MTKPQKPQFDPGDAVYMSVPKPEGEVWPLVEGRILSVSEGQSGCYWYMLEGFGRIVPEDRIRPRLEVSQEMAA